MGIEHVTAEIKTTPVVIPPEAYISRDYAAAEGEKLWSKVWQAACREEEIPKVGDYVTYDILDDSIIVVRSAADTISAYHNVCQHRGRRLTEGCGHTKRLYCKFHGWAWDLKGESSFVLDRQDWQGTLTQDSLRLPKVQVGSWGGFVWINMDPEAAPLKDYLEPAVSMLDPFEFDRMRYRWRKWLHVPCNWKTALEAFNESYHSDGTHPQLIEWGSTRWWSKAQGHCGWHGRGAARDAAGVQGGSTSTGEIIAPAGVDARIAAASFQNELLVTLNAATTESMIDAANRLVEELPADAPFDLINSHFMESAVRYDAERGVIWPDISMDHMIATGHDWHIFPNLILLFGPTFCLCYRARPNGGDPDSCIFEVFVIERFPQGKEPKTEWVFDPEPTEENWLKILAQDFANMPKVQQGMKSRGFKGARPGPVQEGAVIHFHTLLAEYMGTGAPKPLA